MESLRRMRMEWQDPAELVLLSAIWQMNYGDEQQPSPCGGRPHLPAGSFLLNMT